jgi:hypothetical protein
MNRGSSLRIGNVLLAGVLLLAGCAAVTLDKDLSLTPEMLQQRQLQTRRFDTTDEQRILKTCAALLQDTGFSIDESDTQLGLLTASKERDATDAAQWAVFIVGAFVGVSIPPDKGQIMKALVTTRRVGSGGQQVSVRVTFERIVFDTEHRLKTIEALNEPQIYQSFFEKLSKAVFLEAHDI